jgi:ParB family chromosome partitioning protein
MPDHADSKSRLGRGLEALIGDEPVGGASRSEVALGDIEANPYQPRKTFDDDELASLQESIKNHGILQPLVVRHTDGGRFQLVAGERRLRAAQLAGLSSVPVTVVDFNDQQSYEAALVENVQRADLNPIDKATGFKDYLSRYQMTHEQLAARLGLGRATITNLVALLDLPPDVQALVRSGQLSLGHAKILKGVEGAEKQSALAREIIGRGLSVHALDAMLKAPTPEKEEKEGQGKSAPAKTRHVQGVEDDLKRRMGLKVEIKLKAKDRGQVVLSFESNDDFERIVDALRK